MSSFDRALILNGSPRENGVTTRLIARAEAQLKQAGCGKITRFDCYENATAPCIACGDCERQLSCRFHDLDALYAALQEADLLLIASPVYNLGFPAPLKAVIDRLQPFYCARCMRREPLPPPKKGIALLCCGGDGGGVKAYFEEPLRQLGTVINTRFSDILIAPSMDAGCDLEDIFITLDQILGG